MFAHEKGRTVTSRCGPSSLLRPFSVAGLPIWKLPPGTGTMSKVTGVPAMVSV